MEKIDRKGYTDPIFQMGDISGVRVAHLYLIEAERIGAFIESQFDLVRPPDRKDEPDGYTATHYDVRFPKEGLRGRYSGLESYICEIQVRTILDDAWSQVSGQLAYNVEFDLGEEFESGLRGLKNGLRGMDYVILTLRAIRDRVRSEREPNRSVTLENVTELIQAEFRDLPLERPGQAEKVLELLASSHHLSYRNIEDLRDVLQKSVQFRAAMDREFYSAKSCFDQLVRAMVCQNPEFMYEAFPDRPPEQYQRVQKLLDEYGC